jgi:Phytanoyl-CoA dioxygenase (PhyH)
MLLKATFKNREYEKAMERNGFVAIPGFLGAEKTAKLLALYKKHHTTIESDSGMWNSMYNLSKEVTSQVSESILQTLAPELTSLFENYAAPVASFMSKNPNELGVCDLHRDFSILDETKFEYRNVWIPLIDITLQNGALYALAGSHTKFNYPLPMFCKWPYAHLQDELFKQVEVFTVKAGDLVVYADRTLHGSFLNKSQEPRPVVHLGALPSDYELAYYYLSPDNLVKVFKVPYSFFFENNFGDQTGRFTLLHSFLFEPPLIKQVPEEQNTAIVQP